PSFSGVQLSSSPSGEWGDISAVLSTNAASLRITVQDPDAGLEISTGYPTGLVGQWHFEEGIGTATVDASTMSMTGKLIANPAWTAGRQGNALSFNAGSGVLFPATPINGLGNWTMAAWIKPAVLPQQSVAVSNGSGSTGYAFGVGDGAGASGYRLQALAYGTGFIETGYTFPAANQWYHVAMVRSGTTISFYVNGVQTSSTSNTTTPGAATMFTLGFISNNAAYKFNGAVDELRLYNLARSSVQVLADYQSDTLAAHNRSKAYNVLYSTTAGYTWNYVSTASISLTGTNASQTAQTLQADNIRLAQSTVALTNQVAFTASDMAGNISTAVYSVIVDTTLPPTLIAPANTTAVSTAMPALAWSTNTSGNHRLQLATDTAFASVIADSVTANSFYISTNSLAHASTYYWRVRWNGSVVPSWSATFSFVVDLASPTFSGLQLSSSPSGQWGSLAATMSTTVVSLRISVQDPDAGLDVSTGLPAGLVGQWHFEEGIVTMTLDASTIGANGALFNSPTWTPGKLGNALSFNGSDTYVKVLNTPNFLTNLTAEVWINPTVSGNSAYRTILAKRDGGSVTNYELFLGNDAGANQGRLSLYANLVQYNSPYIPVVGQWTHVAVTVKNGNQLTMYANGLPVYSATMGSALVATTGNLAIGRPGDNGGGQYFQGAIDEVRLFNVTRSSVQVLADYQSDTLAAHSRSKAYSVMYSTTAGYTWNYVSTNSISLTGANSDRTAQTLEADNIPLAISTYASTNLVAFMASDMAGNVSTAGPFAVLVKVFSEVPGCGQVKNVKYDGTGDFARIQPALDSLTKPRPTTTCIVVRDTQTYSEQVTVQGFTFSYATDTIRIMSDPSFISSAPVVNPPAASTAAFQVANSSVSLEHITVITTNTVAYGVLASSALVRISSVNVDSGGKIWTAGISLSTWNYLSYSSITVQNADAIRLVGSSGTTVAFSSAQSAGSAYSALSLVGASSNTFSVFFASSTSGSGVTLSSGSNYNALANSTMTSSSSSALYIVNSSSNSISQGYIYSASGRGAFIFNSSKNLITGSAMISNDNSGNYAGLSLSSAWSNAISGSFMQGRSGDGAYIYNSSYNVISNSTMTNVSSGNYTGLHLDNARANSISASFMYSEKAEGLLIYNSSSNTITASTMVGANYANCLGACQGVLFTLASSNTISNSFIFGPQYYGVTIDASSATTINNSTITANITALVITKSSASTVSGSYLQAPSYAIDIQGSTDTILRSNIIISTADVGGTSMGVALRANSQNLDMSYNTVQAAPLGWGIWLGSGNSGRILIATNTIRAGARYGLYINNQASGAQVWVTSNTISVTTATIGDTYGLYLSGLTSGATIYNNGIYYRLPGDISPRTAYGLYATGSSGINFHHNRINNPGMITGGSAVGAYFTGNSTSIDFDFNDVNSTGTGLTNAYLLQLAGSTVSAKNNIFLSSWTVSGTAAGLSLDAGSGIDSDYNDWFTSNTLNTAAWGARTYATIGAWQATGKDLNSIAANPLWYNVSANTEDFHPRSTQGRWHDGAFDNDGYSSLTIDAADTQEPYANETAPNGSRANQGSYGNTDQASRSIGAAVYCAVQRNVHKTNGPYFAIQSAVDSLPKNLPGPACVIIKDNAVYAEQATVQGFTNNGSSITIMLEPILSARPTVAPPAGSTAAFLIMQTSVNIFNIDIRPTVNVAYGVRVSSQLVSISSVNVDAGGHIGTAGVSLSTWNYLSYSSITVSASNALELIGSSGTTVAFSSAVTQTGTYSALYLNGASSNTFTVFFASNAGGRGVILSTGSDYNTFDQSLLVSSYTQRTLYIYNSSFNTIRRSFIYQLNAEDWAAIGLSGAGHNTIDQSTVTGGRGVELYQSSSNTISGSFLSAPYWEAVDLNDSSSNTITASVLLSSRTALYLEYGSCHNRITGSLMSSAWGAGAVFFQDSDSNTVSGSTMTGATFGLNVVSAASSTISGSFMYAAAGYGARFGNSNYNSISDSTMTGNGSVSGSAGGLRFNNSDSNSIIRSFMTGPSADGLYSYPGSSNAISNSTMTGQSTGIYARQSSSNTFDGSFMSAWNSGEGAYFWDHSDHNAIKNSTL
ncbi:MAG: LamG-like jellyroll fold domain-containing protein, partial [Elusimicrobiota bacterium]